MSSVLKGTRTGGFRYIALMLSFYSGHLGADGSGEWWSRCVEARWLIFSALQC